MAPSLTNNWDIDASLPINFPEQNIILTFKCDSVTWEVETSGGAGAPSPPFSGLCLLADGESVEEGVSMASILLLPSRNLRGLK